MILTFDPDKYRYLLDKYQPKIIRTEEENEKALEIVEELMNCPNRTPEEDELYDLLIVLIEKFEREYYSPGKVSTPHSMLCFLMEQQGIQQADLVGVIGSKGVVSEVVNGKRGISKAQANALGEFFQVDPGLFI
jgi:HTH-type transcriptional regulator / antitoxin HigA